jgi:hypothetical protein
MGENMYTKLPVNYQMALKCTKWLLYIPKGIGKFHFFQLQGPPIFAQIFGLKIYHLATLLLKIKPQRGTVSFENYVFLHTYLAQICKA